ESIAFERQLLGSREAYIGSGDTLHASTKDDEGSTAATRDAPRRLASDRQAARAATDVEGGPGRLHACDADQGRRERRRVPSDVPVVDVSRCVEGHRVH